MQHEVDPGPGKAIFDATHVVEVPASLQRLDVADHAETQIPAQFREMRMFKCSLRLGHLAPVDPVSVVDDLAVRGLAKDLCQTHHGQRLSARIPRSAIYALALILAAIVGFLVTRTLL